MKDGMNGWMDEWKKERRKDGRKRGKRKTERKKEKSGNIFCSYLLAIGQHSKLVVEVEVDVAAVVVADVAVAGVDAPTQIHPRHQNLRKIFVNCK